MLKNKFLKAAVFYSVLISFIFLPLLQAETIAPEISDKPAEKISLDFTDANLTDVLRLLSQQAGVSFVPTKEVMEAKVTMLMENVTVDDAISALMGANDLYFEKSAGGVNIVRKSGEPEIKTETKIYTLNYIQLGKEGAGKAVAGTETQSLIDTIAKILTPNGQVVADTRTNSLIITDVPVRFDLIAEVIARLDSPTSQVLIEVEIIETSAKLLDNLGIQWGTDGGVVLSTSAIVPTKSYSFPLSQFKADSTPADTMTLGTLSINGMQAVLTMIKTDSSSRFLARPKVMVLNNETAEIKIVSDQAVSLKETIETTTSGSNTTTEVERMEIGTTLKVTPLINNLDMVTLKIQPEVSRAVDSEFVIKAQKVINKQTQKTDTVVILRSGETVVIGGLITTEDTESSRAVPYISDIPLLGGFFKYKSKDRKDKELLIFLTPHVVKTLENIALPAGSMRTEEKKEAATATETPMSPPTKATETALQSKPAITPEVKSEAPATKKIPLAREQSAATAIKPEIIKPQPQKEKSFIREQ